MIKAGLINIDISLPVIGILGNNFWVIQKKESLTVSNSKFLQEYHENKQNLTLLDSTGNYYECTKIEKLGYTNNLWGFNFLTGASTFFVKIYLEKGEEWTIDKLKKFGVNILDSEKNFFESTMLNIKKWKMSFLESNDKEEILRYLFYFVDPGRYNNPDKKDLHWRERVGIPK